MGEKIVALDIGSTSIKGVEAVINKKSGLPQITKIAEVFLDSRVVEDGEIKLPESLALAIGQLWRQGKFEAKNVYAMAAGNSIIIRELDKIPYSDPESFKKLFPYLIRDRIQFDIEDYYLDEHTLDTYVDDITNQRVNRILVSGVDKQYVDTLIECLKQNRLRPMGIDVAPFSLVRAYGFSHPEETSLEEQETDEVGFAVMPFGSTRREKEVVASVEIGATVTTVILHSKGQPVYVQTSPYIGGQRTTDRISQEQHLTRAEAEMVKVGLSFPEEIRSQFSQTIVREGGVGEEISWSKFDSEVLRGSQEIISQDSSQLITLINETFENSYDLGDYSITKIVLSGGGSKLATFAQRLSSELGKPVEFAEPFGEERSKKINDAIFAEQYRFVAAFGLLVGQENNG